MWQSAYDFVFNSPSDPNPPTDPVEPPDYGDGAGPWKDADPGNIWVPTGFSDRENQWVADDWRYGENSQYQPMVLPQGWDPYEIDDFTFSEDQAGYGWYTSDSDLGSFSALMHSPWQTGNFSGTQSIGKGFAGFKRPSADGGGPADSNEAVAAYYDQTWDENTRTRTGNTRVKDDWKVDPWTIKPGEGFDPAQQAGWDFDLSNNLFSNMNAEALDDNYYWDIAPTQGTTPVTRYGSGGRDWRDLGSQAYGMGSWLRAGAVAAGDEMNPDMSYGSDFRADDQKSWWDARNHRMGKLTPGHKTLDWHGLVGTADEWWDLFGDSPGSAGALAGKWDQTDARDLDWMKDEKFGGKYDHFVAKADTLLGMKYGEVPDEPVFENAHGKQWYETGGNDEFQDWLYPGDGHRTYYSTPNMWEHNVGKDAFSVWSRTTGRGKHDYDKSVQDGWTTPDDWAQMPEQFWNGEHHGWMAPHDPRNTTDDWEYQHPDNPAIDWDYQPPTDPPGDDPGDFSPIWQQRSTPVSQSVFNYDQETAGYQLDLDSGSYGYASPGSTLSRYKNYSPYRRGTTSELEGRSGSPRKPYQSARTHSEMVPWLPTPYNDDPGWFYGE